MTPEQLLASTANWPERMLVEVGRELHEGRTAEPIDDPDLDYDQAINIQYRAFAMESCGFRIEAKPRRIGVKEVADYADSSCRSCHGVGYWPVTRTAAVQRDDAGNKVLEDLRYLQSCGCADRHYKRQHKQMLIDSQLGEWIALEGLVIESVPNEDR